MSDLADIVTALETLYGSKAELNTVLTAIPSADLEQADLPALLLDVEAASSRVTSHRRTMYWPISHYLLVTERTKDLAADLELLYPWPETVIGWLDQSVTLGGVLSDPYQWRDPMMTDPGPFGWLKKTYMTIILHPVFPVKLEKAFHV